MATLGIDYITKNYCPQGASEGVAMQVKLWDTAGQERFRTLNVSFYKQAHGIIICFDVTNANSFKNVKSWLESIYQHVDSNIAKVLVGNKIDRVEDRRVSEQDAREMARLNNMNYYETSAKKNHNIDAVMEDIMSQIYNTRFTSFVD